MATRLDDLGVRALVPRDDPIGAVAAELLRRACGPPLVDALDVAADALRGLDPGAYWVIRELGVHVSVPASETDPDAQAGRLAAALVSAIERAVRRGPDPDAVRFPSAADYGASFVRAVLAGSSGAWVYDRLAGLRGLRPADALVAGAVALGVPPLAVFTVLAATGGIPRLLLASTAAELTRLDGALHAASTTGSPVPRRLLDIVRDAAAIGPVHPGGVAPIAAARRLELLARLVATATAATDALVAAVFAVVPDAADAPGHPDRASWTPPADSPSGVAQYRTASARGAVPPWTITAAGAIAFLLVADLDSLLAERPDRDEPDDVRAAVRVLAGPSAAAARLRCGLLAAALGPAVSVDDAALGLAAGVDPIHPADPAATADAVAALSRELAPWAEGVAADPRWSGVDDGDWFAGADPIIGSLAAVLLRRFAAHLTGFGRSPAGYLAERVLPPGGTVVVTADLLHVSLPPVPLQIVLGLAGLDGFVVRPAWLDRPITVTHESAP